MARKPGMTTTQALALALLALDDQARQPGNLADEMYEARLVVNRLLDRERPSVDRDDLSVQRSNFGNGGPGSVGQAATASDQGTPGGTPGAKGYIGLWVDGESAQNTPGYLLSDSHRSMTHWQPTSSNTTAREARFEADVAVPAARSIISGLVIGTLAGAVLAIWQKLASGDGRRCPAPMELGSRRRPTIGRGLRYRRQKDHPDRAAP